MMPEPSFHLSPISRILSARRRPEEKYVVLYKHDALSLKDTSDFLFYLSFYICQFQRTVFWKTTNERNYVHTYTHYKRSAIARHQAMVMILDSCSLLSDIFPRSSCQLFSCSNASRTFAQNTTPRDLYPRLPGGICQLKWKWKWDDHIQ